MATPVSSTRLLKLSEMAIRKSNRKVEDIFSIAKILLAKQILKTAKEEPGLASRTLTGEPQKQWAALGAAHQMANEKSESEILEYIYDFARTHLW